jgi:Fe-S oxidoreductase
MSERADVEVDEATALHRCSFCHDQCMSATPEAVFTGDQQHVVSRVAIRIRRTAADRGTWTVESAGALFGGLTSGLQREYCIFQDGSQNIDHYLRSARRLAVEQKTEPESVRTYSAQVAISGSELGDVAVAAPAALEGASPGAGLLLVGGDAARLLDPDGWRSALALLGDGASALGVGSSGYVEYTLGLRELAARAAQRAATAIAAYGPVERLVTTDPAFAYAVRVFWPALGIEAPWPIVTLPEYLAGFAGVQHVNDDGVTSRSEVTYHDPGVLARGLGVVDAPRLVLARAGARVIEPFSYGTRASDDGGYPGYAFAEVARRVAVARAEELEATGASVVVTASPWSIANLRAVTHLSVVDLASYLVSATNAPAEEANRA